MRLVNVYLKSASGVCHATVPFQWLLFHTYMDHMITPLVASSQILAKEIVHSRKAVGRLYVNKAQMMSISSALTEQLGESQHVAIPATARLV